MNAAWLRPRWLFSRRAAKALLLAVVIIAAAVGANLVGIYLVGSVAGWERWLAASATMATTPAISLRTRRRRACASSSRASSRRRIQTQP